MVMKLFWEEKFHAPNGKAPKHTLKVPCFFFFSLLSLVSGKDSFHFSLVPNVCVLTMFSMGSHHIPNTFPKFSMSSPTCSPQHLTFIPYSLANMFVLLSLI